MMAYADSSSSPNAALFHNFPCALRAASACSPTAGRGVFATRDIPAGEVVLRSRSVAATGHRKHVRQYVFTTLGLRGGGAEREEWEEDRRPVMCLCGSACVQRLCGVPVCVWALSLTCPFLPS